MARAKEAEGCPLLWGCHGAGAMACGLGTERVRVKPRLCKDKP